MSSIKRLVAGQPHPPCWVFDVSDMPYKLRGSEDLVELSLYANQSGRRMSLVVFDAADGIKTGILLHDIDEDTPDCHALTTLCVEIRNLEAACKMSTANPAIFDEIRAMREDIKE